MAIRESLVIGTDGLERDLKKVEGAVVASAERQGKAVKAAAKRSTKEVVQEYEKAAKEGGRVGKTWADQILDDLRATLRTRRAQIKEAFSRGAFDRATMRQMNQEARREFDKGILKALDQMKEKGEANQQEYLKLARALQAVGPAGRKSLEEVESRAGRLRRTMQGLVTSTRAWIAGFVGIQALRLALAITRDFATETSKLEASMTRSLAIMTGVTSSLRQEMDEQARLLSRRLNVDADKVAEGYRFLAAAGLDAQQSLASIGTVSTFAKAGMFDLARATDLLTDAQSALGLASKDVSENLEGMRRVADVLTRANTIANASVEQFSEALTNRAAPALRIVNKDVEEGVAILAAMADQGVKGAEAGTRLDIVLRDLQRTALNNREIIAQYNVEVFDSTGTLRNMADIIGDLERALDGMSDAQRRATIMQMGFQDRSVAALLTLVGTSEKIREYEQALRDAAGTTQRVADTMLSSFEERMGKVGQRWAEAKRWAGEYIALPVAEAVMGLANALLDLDDPFDRAIEQMERFGIAAEAIMILQLDEQLRRLREETSRLEREIKESVLVVGSERIIQTGGRRVGYETIDVGRMTEAQVQEEARRAVEALHEATEKGDRAAMQRMTRRLEQLEQFLQKMQQLQLATEQLGETETALRQLRARATAGGVEEGLEAQIESLRIALADLEAQGGETAGVLAEIARLEKELASVRAGAETGTEGGMPITEEQIRAGEAATKALAASMRELALANSLGVDSLKDAMPEVRAALRELLAINEQVETAEQQIADIRAAGMDVPPGAERYLDYLRKLQAELREVAEREIERWQRDLPEAVAEIQQSLSGIVSIMIPMEGGARTLESAMQGVVARTKAVKEAEQELLRAQLARDPARIARAEKELADAREDLAEFTARLTVALEAAGLPAEELEERIKRLQEYLNQAGVETDKTKGRFENLGKQAQTIAGLARGVLSVADAMGSLDDRTRRALEGVINLGDGIARLVSSGGTDIGTWAQTLGSLVQLGSSLFGEDPEAKRRAEELKRSLERLTDALWELNQSVVRESTRQLERDRDAARRGLESIEGSQFISASGGIPPWYRQAIVDQLAADMGLSTEGGQAATDALRRWAREMDDRYSTGGVLSGFIEQGNIKGFREALREIIPGIEDQIGRAGAFGSDPAGVIQRVDFELDILGETDAAERLRAVVQALKDAGHEAGEFQEALDELASLDLDTPEGRARRDQLVREMTEALVRGGADLGELTADQIQDLIRGWVEASPAPGVSRSVQIGTSITEVQANEVIAWLEDIALTLREIRDGSGPAPELAIEIATGLRDLVSTLAARAQTITPEILEAVISNHFDFRGAQFGRFSEQDLDEWLQELRAEILQRNKRGF